MHEVKQNKTLNDEDFLLEVEAPVVAKKHKPGQFVVLRVHEKGERIPMSVFEKTENTISVPIKKLGKTSHMLSELEPGDHLEDVIGPMGKPLEIKDSGRVICSADLVCGYAEMYDVGKELKKRDNHVIQIMNFPSEDMVYFKEDVKKESDEFYLVTEDGSAGREGTSAELIERLLEEEDIDFVFAGGQISSAKEISELAESYNVPVKVFLRAIMVDATGMCGSCRVQVDGETKFACLDGPYFDGSKVNFDQLMNRMDLYNEQENLAFERYQKERGKE